MSLSMRIAVLGWARLSLQEREGSGYNLSASELAASLAARGHHVAYLRSGVDYSTPLDMRIEAVETWRGVDCFSLINSPNLATGYHNFHNVEAEISSPQQAHLVLAWLDAHAADVVHVQSIEGFSLDLIAAIRASGRPVVATLHNFFYLCQQVDLLHDERVVCEDYDGGRRCLGCMAWPDPNAESDRRREASRLSPHPMERAPGTRQVELSVRSVGSPIDELRDVVVRHDPAAAILASPNVHSAACNQHGIRRRAGIAALNAANVVLCPGRTLLRVHEAMGVDSARLLHSLPGQPHFDALEAEARARQDSHEAPWTTGSARPLRLAFFGNTKLNKGIATLIEAIERLPIRALERLHIDLHATGEDGWCRQRLERYGNVHLRGGYDLTSLPRALFDADAVAFPNRGLDNAPFVVLESLHAGRFLIASRLGASVDLISVPEAGVLFEPADPNALALTILSILEGRIEITSPQRVRRASTLRSHADVVAEAENVMHCLLRATSPGEIASEISH